VEPRSVIRVLVAAGRVPEPVNSATWPCGFEAPPPLPRQAIHQPLPHRDGDVRIPGLNRAVRVAHPVILQGRRYAEFLHRRLMRMP
jgi:hypothetical protein